MGIWVDATNLEAGKGIMSITNFELKEKVRRDFQVMREGADIDTLHDDLVPLSSFLNRALRVLFTFFAALFLPLLVSVLFFDPKGVGIEVTDSSWDALLKISTKYASIEFVWGLAAGLLLTIIVMFSCIRIFKLRRKRGWTTISTAYELESLFAIRPIYGLPYVEDALEEIMDRKSDISESMMSFETMLGDYFDDGLPKVIMVTSSQPGEGKSTLSIGLSATIARVGRSVVLVDADLRSPTIHRYIKGYQHVGLSNSLVSSEPVEVKTSSMNFDVVFAGPIPPSSADLLRTNRLQEIVSELSERYDHVIIDTPPVLGLVDAVRISRCSDLVLFAIEANYTWIYHALGAIRRLRATNIVPVVTKIPSSQAGYSYGYSYGYAYGYGRKRL